MEDLSDPAYRGVRVEGHAHACEDEVEAEPSRLSLARATAVAAELRAASWTRPILAAGFGARHPRAPCPQHELVCDFDSRVELSVVAVPARRGADASHDPGRAGDRRRGPVSPASAALLAAPRGSNAPVLTPASTSAPSLRTSVPSPVQRALVCLVWQRTRDTPRPSNPIAWRPGERMLACLDERHRSVEVVDLGAIEPDTP